MNNRSSDSSHMPMSAKRIADDVGNVGSFVCQIAGSPYVRLHPHCCAIASTVFIILEKVAKPVIAAVAQG
ncbi:hypothetical protein D3C85_1436560 [compost metagenome]